MERGERWRVSGAAFGCVVAREFCREINEELGSATSHARSIARSNDRRGVPVA